MDSPVLLAWAKHLHEEVIYDHGDPVNGGTCPHCLKTARELFDIQQKIIAEVRLDDRDSEQACELIERLSFSRERLLEN